MKKYCVFFVALLVCLFLLNTNMFSRSTITPPQRETVVVADEMMVPKGPDIIKQERVSSEKDFSKGIPVFDFGAIKLKSAGLGKCTGVTLVPTMGQLIEIRSQRFTKSFFGSEARPGKLLSEWMELNPGGMRVKFDRAGGPHDYYKIYCRIKEGNRIRTAECRDVVTIQGVKTGHCSSGPGGTEAKYAPLNMTIKKK